MAERPLRLGPQRGQLLTEPDDVLGKGVDLTAPRWGATEPDDAHHERGDRDHRREQHQEEHATQTTMQR